MKDSYYFTHDSNAKDDPKCTLLIDQLGLEGYGIYWVLVEILREQDGYKYPLALLPSVARKYNTTLEKVKTVVFNYGLFIVEGDKIFYSSSLMKRMLPWDEKKKKLSEAGKKGNLKRWGTLSSGESGRESGGDRYKIREDKIKEEYIYGESNNSPSELSFENIWNLYGKKGNKKTSQKKWDKLSIPEKKLALAHIPLYIQSTPDKQFRKHFETYINQEVWNDEIQLKQKENETESTIHRVKLHPALID